MIVRPATREDIDAYPWKVSFALPTMRAWVGELDGKLVGICGVGLVKGRWLAFCDLEPEARPFKYRLARNVIKGIDALKKQGVRFIYCEADPNEPGAVRWLRSLGFSLDPKTQLYRWSA